MKAKAITIFLFSQKKKKTNKIKKKDMSSYFSAADNEMGK